MFPFGWFDGGIGIWFLIVFVFNAVFWIGLIALIFFGIRWLIRNNQAGGSSGQPNEDAAMAVLRQRFARGEIDAAEFEERKRALGG
jgi:putative membrane protein